LGKALYHALPPALGNGVTIGGSIAFSAVWSDIYAPLSALSATVTDVKSGFSRLPFSALLREDPQMFSFLRFLFTKAETRFRNTFALYAQALTTPLSALPLWLKKKTESSQTGALH
jgi:hypothetical protein